MAQCPKCGHPCPDCEARAIRKNEYNKSWNRANRERINERRRRKKALEKQEEEGWKKNRSEDAQE